MRHELTTNVAEVLSLLLGVFLITSSIGQVTEVTPTLTALMVLWVNMVSDSLPSFALGYDEAESDVMKQRPRDAKQSILANGMLKKSAPAWWCHGWDGFCGLRLGSNARLFGSPKPNHCLSNPGIGELWHVYDARSVKTLFDRNPFSNSRLTLAVGFAATSSILVTLMPFFNNVMGTAPLSMPMYVGIIIISAIPTFAISGIKKLVGMKSQTDSSQLTQLDSE